MAVEPSIRRARAADENAVVRILQEYYDSASVVVRDDPDNLQQYLAGNGGLWLALINGAPVGCVALRPLRSAGSQACEVKRLYVAPARRGQGIADLLYAALEAFARSSGFRSIYLDTTDSMQAAIRFYERHGFGYCERYNDNPQATLFMRKSLG
jgi:ribosomal protein S18 acetylase RimI-like enzyme